MRDEVLYDTFLGIHKAYDALYIFSCLVTIEVYGVGPRFISILWRYWYRLTVVARSGVYFDTLFKGVSRGHKWRPHIPHNFRRGGVRHDMALYYIGSDNGGGFKQLHKVCEEEGFVLII